MTRGFKFLGILEQDFQHDVTHELPQLGFACYTFHMVQNGGAQNRDENATTQHSTSHLSTENMRTFKIRSSIKVAISLELTVV